MSLRIDNQSLGNIADLTGIEPDKNPTAKPTAATGKDVASGDTTTLSLVNANVGSSLTTLQDAQSAQELVTQTSALLQNSPVDALAAQANLDAADVQALLG